MTPASQALQGARVAAFEQSGRAIAEQLQQLGLQVDEGPDSDSAQQLVATAMSVGRPYDLFVIDWRMPGLDGIQTLDSLRQQLGGVLPPSVLATAYDEPAMWRQTREARYDTVLVKPITPSALDDALVTAMRQPGSPLAPELAADVALDTLRRRHAGQRVLRAEDNPVNQEVGGELLSAAHLVVEFASDGEVALELASTRAYDLILMDVQMPRMDGLNVRRAIRQRWGRATPIVAMTAYAFGEDRRACLAAGMNDHIAKPVDPPALYATLLRWLPLPLPLPATATAVADAPPPPAA